MFSQPNLSQSKQPEAHYDYDGLSGAWLWLPWWVHIIVAIVAWPLSWWILPILPFQNSSISEFLFNYKIQIASALSILTVMTAFLSYLKAYRIRNRRKSTKIKQPTSVAVQNNDSSSNVKPKAKRAVKKVEENSVAEAKPKKTTKKPSESTQKTSKVSDVKSEKKPVAKKKRTTTKKKNDQQSQLDF